MHHSTIPITRRGFLVTTGAALASAAWPARASAWWPNDDWPMAAHDLAGTRSTPLGVRRIPGVRWRVALAGGVPGAAAVVGRTVVA
ncbi:MAG TPA: hypothetical protein VNT55_10260, partial [Baekduia sp.]|nr:hypothetical protein [Baekduia sp.]